MSDETTDRLQQLQGELASILTERLGALTTAVRATEAAGRRILSAELDIARHADDRARLEGELSALEAELDVARGRSAGLRAAAAERLAQTEAERQELVRLEAEVREADAEAERFRRRVGLLTAEADAIRDENAALKTKVRTLEENIQQLRAIKAEMMASLTEMTAQMSAISGERSA
jgi:chromosome segregation ATPase